MRARLHASLLLLTLSTASAAYAQTPAPSQTPRPAPHLPRGTATDVSNADIMATAEKTASSAVKAQGVGLMISRHTKQPVLAK
jgi:hypothetical protein